MSKRIEIVGDYKDNISAGVSKSASTIKSKATEINSSNNNIRGSFDKIGESFKKSIGGISSFGTSISSVGSKIASLGLSALKVVPALGIAAAAIAAVGAASLKVIIDVVNMADKLDELAERLGMGVVETQKWARVLKLAGTSIEEIQPSMDILQKNMVSAATGSGEMSKAFELLGLSVKNSDGNFKSADAMFTETVKKLADMEDVTQRNALAMQIFGKAGAKLIPVLNQGSAGIENNLKASAKYVAVSDQAAKASGKFNDILDDLKSLLTKIKVEAFTYAIDILSNAFESLIDSPILDFFGFLAKVIGGVVTIAIGVLTKSFQALDLAVRGVILILKSFFLLFVAGISKLVKMLPDKLVPTGWKESLQEFTDFLSNDFTKSADEAAVAAERLLSIKPSNYGSSNQKTPTQDNQDPDPFKNVLKIPNFSAIWEEFHKIGKTEREKELMDLNWWMEDQLKVVGENLEKRNALYSVYNDRLRGINKKYEDQAADAAKDAAEKSRRHMEELKRQVEEGLEGIAKARNERKDLENFWGSLFLPVEKDFGGFDRKLREIEDFYDKQDSLAQNAAMRIGANEEALGMVYAQNDANRLTEKNALTREKTSEYVSIVVSGINQVNNAISQAFQYQQQLEDERTQRQIDNVKQNVRGKRAQEDAIRKIEENAEKERKKIRKRELMLSWATAIANTAEGVSKAIAQGGVAGIITGAAVGAAGAIQTGIILAQISKLAKGGIVGGQGQSDTEPALLTPGEMVLNKGQQAKLFALANGASAPGGAGSNITFNESIVVHGNLDSAAAEQIRVDREKQLMGLKSMMQELSYRGQLSSAVFA